ncbi:MAG: hypothetical protein QOG53_3427 [Frankiales bacterium]|jgi:hypothetical protein|nr:hypothetical protein [Frankiales bacterium]
MTRFSADELVLDRGMYAERRPAERDRMIPLRRDRRLRLGDQLVCEFENAETLRYQVQEMVYAEGISDPGEAAAEVEAYARMLPTSHELCCTLFIELEDPRTVKDELARLSGVHHSLRIDVGGESVPGRELPGVDEELEPETTASVHFLRFAFTDEQRDAFRDPSVPAVLAVDHPEYADEVPISGPTRISLLADLALDPS